MTQLVELLYSIEPFLYIAFLLTIVLSIYAQYKVSSTFRRESKNFTRAGRNATDVARMILYQNGISHVSIARVAGNLTDHFNPSTNTLALSDSVYMSTSSAAIGVAAHEAGHAIQHNVGYFPIRLRGWLVPVTSFASRISWILILLGSVFFAFSLLGDVGYLILLLGVVLFSITTLFQLVTLPCEFNASRRAMKALRASGWYAEDELRSAKRVLSAAALTYVAETLVSVVQLLRLLVMLLGRRGDRR